MKAWSLLVSLVAFSACGQISMTGGMSASGGTSMGPPILEFAFGDSVTTGAGANNPTSLNGYVGQVATHYGWQAKNFAVSGTAIGDTQQFQHQSGARILSANYHSLTLIGINDVFHNPNGTLDLDNWANAAMADILFASVVYSDNIRIRDGAWTQVGTWSNGSSGVPVYDADGTRQTSTVGDNATVSVSGTALYLVWLAFDSGDVSFDVSIDGTSKGTFSNVGSDQSFNNINYHYYPVAARFAGLSSGAHSLKVTYSSGTTPLILMWVTGNANANKPRYYVGNCIPEQNNAQASSIAALNSRLQTIVSQLNGDGLKAYYVDANSVVNPVSDLCSQLHPCQSGYDHMTTKFESVIDANP